MSQNQNIPLKSYFSQAYCQSNAETIKYSHRYMQTDRYSSPFPVPVEANSNPYLTATDTVELGFEGLPLISHAMGNPSQHNKTQHSIICPTSLWIPK